MYRKARPNKQLPLDDNSLPLEPLEPSASFAVSYRSLQGAPISCSMFLDSTVTSFIQKHLLARRYLHMRYVFGEGTKQDFGPIYKKKIDLQNT